MKINVLMKDIWQAKFLHNSMDIVTRSYALKGHNKCKYSAIT